MNGAARWLLTVMFLAAACAAPEKSRWTQPGGAAGPNPAVWAACRADADRRAEREYLLDTDPRGDRDFTTPGGLQNQLARRDAKRYRRRIYEQCLRSLGYERAPAGRGAAR
jgi:hypothetical protein